MISKPVLSLGALALAAVSSAKPIPTFKDVFAKRDDHSFNGYGGFSSMAHFDDFYGGHDFSGVSQKLVQEKEVVCHNVEVEVVQQHLSVIREWYKKIITEQVCEVEVQTIVHHQFLAGCEDFCSDLRRVGDHHRAVSYDHEIANHIVNIHDSSNECITNDLGFHGVDIGSHAVTYHGDNWNNEHSPEVVRVAWEHSKEAYGYNSPEYVSSWSHVPVTYSYGTSTIYQAPPSHEEEGYVPPVLHDFVPPSHEVYVPPAHEEPSHEVYVPPSHEEPSHEVYVPPSHEEPSHEYVPPSHEEPSHEYVPPAHEEPSHEYVAPPAHEEPSHEYVPPPAHEEPSHEYVPPPAHEEPAHEEPSHEYVPPPAEYVPPSSEYVAPSSSAYVAPSSSAYVAPPAYTPPAEVAPPPAYVAPPPAAPPPAAPPPAAPAYVAPPPAAPPAYVAPAGTPP